MMLKQLLTEKKAVVDNWLKDFLPTEDLFPEKIHEAMAYSIFAGGKRIRPILSMVTAEMLGFKDDIVMIPACAIEMIHTYSLIHDDLPAMDNDDLRRGKPTSHKKFGEDIAILAGDALLTEAFYILSRLPDDKIGPITSSIALSASSRGMVGGQVIDILQTNKNTDIKMLEKMHSLKTGALLKVPLKCAAIMCGEDNLNQFEKLGELIGMLFQVTDDILDVRGDEKVLGKPIGSDSFSGKSTFVSLLGIDKAIIEAKKYLNDSLECLNDIKVRDERAKEIFKELIEFIYKRSN